MSINATRDQPRTYAGWQPEKVAFIFGLTGRRAAMLGAAVLAATMPIATTRLSEGVIFWPAAALLTTAAFVRIAGRTADDWLMSLASYQLLALRGRHKFASGPFTPHRDDGEHSMDLPGVLAPLRVLAVPSGWGRDLAVIEHGHDRTYTAVARVRFPGIGLSDSARRDHRVAGWGALLAGLCTEGNPLVRVQALQRLVPESGVALRSWHQAHMAGDAPELARQVTAELLASSTLATSRREAYLAFTMDARRAHAAIRAAGGGETGAAAVLVRQLHALSSGIGGADLEIEEWLGTRDLAEVVRIAFDPHSQVALASRRAAAASAETRGAASYSLAPGTALPLAGPAYAEAKPGCYVHDGAVSVSYWVQDWPRAQAWCTALAPLLADGSHRRSFGMIFEPLSPRTAEREVMRERTSRHVAVRMRQRTGQVIPEHERVALERALSQDAERAAGHGLVRFTGYATVTVTDPAALEDACAALEADAAASRIELRRIWFAQDVGFALGALPLGLGLPRKRW